MELQEGDVLAINKPRGMSSHGVVARLRRLTGIKRIGHAGTLDPLARGVLIMLIGRSATKRQAEFMSGVKEYEAEITFGSVSDTYDAEGPFHQKASLEQLGALTEEKIRALIPQFVGEIQQKPPLYSAIKRAGKPLYAYARQGKESELEEIQARPVQIDDIELVQFVPATPPFPPTVRLRIVCQKGTYIRSIAHDMGEVLGVGAYLSDLLRTRVGDFTLDKALDLETLSKTE